MPEKTRGNVHINDPNAEASNAQVLLIEELAKRGVLSKE